jgi:hypothetical protein
MIRGEARIICQYKDPERIYLGHDSRDRAVYGKEWTGWHRLLKLTTNLHRTSCTYRVLYQLVDALPPSDRHPRGVLAHTIAVLDWVGCRGQLSSGELE